MNRIVGYEIFAFSPSTEQLRKPNVLRSAITVAEAEQQANQLVNFLNTTTDIKDWQARWKLFDGAVDIEAVDTNVE